MPPTDTMRALFLPLIIAVAPAVAHAELEVPKFKKGGFLITLQAGAGVPHIDTLTLDQQFSPVVAGAFYSRVPSESLGLGLRLAYNILGYASVGADFTAAGWNVFDARRSDAGFLVGLVAFHPMNLFFLNKEERPFGLDFSMGMGVGYGIAGVSGPPALGMDGVVWQWNMTIDYFFNRYFALEFFAKCNFLNHLDKFYWDWDSAHAGGPGVATVNPSGGGTWWHTGLAIVLRVGD